ncbi:DNA topoisomerase 4 subunit A [Telmatocola sphagniphila]|uniref:DNA topoisomerase (ATP-hydrolyzing) n=1 Tax=Telmatocola sphagniphila TaxID=1123043 RepID=A0A8E6EYU2_9BACT|nr:DNA topoisomerase (ATP-hydrolyzing) [Telmatocola sphagniphila]QVL33038.1 DNA topoisomerase 4 subunit A [Telmatocola sphagniphila]
MPESIPISIAKETQERYLRYALSVITSRALPDVRDGLKPVQRRILYAMQHELRLDFENKAKKCASIVGDVMGKYHPHGDSAIYEALVRMAQNWMMLVPLVHGQGNFGSIMGDSPGAFRYTEAKLAKAASYLMRELRQETVPLRYTFDNEHMEPVVLPAEFPNLLVNGSSGIAVGMATNIPPHNLGEVIRAAILLIDQPDASTAVIMDKIKGPDFPKGGKIISDRTTLRKIYECGNGSIKVQGEWKLEGAGTKKPQIVITSIPYAVNAGKLEGDIGAIIEARKLPQALGVTDESNEKDGFRITIDLKPDADPAMVMAYLYKNTQLQDTFSFNLTCLVPNESGSLIPRQITLKEMLQHFLDFRFDTVKKRFEYELRILKRRIHILEGFRIIFNALDEAIKIIRNSTGKKDAAEKLIARFELDADQTEAILESQLYKIATMEIQKILDELREKKKEAKRIQEILDSKTKLWGVIKDEMRILEETMGERRRTRMASDEDVLEFDEEAYIVRENTNLVLTRDGWIKRVGRLASIETTRVREGDEVIAVVPGSTLDHAVFFADDGTAYTMRMNEIPASSGYGEPITKFFKLDDQVKIVGAETTDPRFVPEETKPESKQDPAGPYLLSVTSAGYTLRTPFAPFRQASTKAGRRYVRLEEKDKVVMARVLRDEESIFLASANGHVIHFEINQINILSGAGKGVMGIKLADGDTCIGGALVGNRHDALTVETSGGITKEFRRGANPIVSRGGKGVEVVKRATLVKINPPPIDLVDWEVIGEPGDVKSKSGKNGQGKLFD